MCPSILSGARRISVHQPAATSRRSNTGGATSKMLELVCATGPANRATPRLRQATPQVDRTIRQVSPVMGPKSNLRSEQWGLGAQSDLKTSGTSGPLGRPIAYCTYFSLAVVLHRQLYVLRTRVVLHRLLYVLSLAGVLHRLLHVL